MIGTSSSRLSCLVVFAVSLAIVGCSLIADDNPLNTNSKQGKGKSLQGKKIDPNNNFNTRDEPEPKEPKIDPTKPVIPQPKTSKIGRMPGKHVFLQTMPNKKRRVLVNAYVCMRMGQLEQLLCKKRTKEHEALLAADVDARMIHFALNAAGAKEGSPVQFVPQYKPAYGTIIKISLQYKDKKGKLITVAAQKWILNIKTSKDMKYDWVFAGSKLLNLGPQQPKYYAANDGDVICVSNFDTAMLDLPVEVTNANAALIYEAHTTRIPPLGTPVQVILEPVLMQKKKQK